MDLTTLIRHLDTRFPRSLGESWDNTGLLVADSRSSVRRAMTALTLTEDVADEAIETGCEFVLAHHPVLFRGAKSLTADTAEGVTLLKLIRAGIAVYSPHTRFDSAAAGINALLASRLGLKEVAPMRPLDDDPAIGGGRFGLTASPTTVDEFAGRVAEVCQVSGLHTVHGGRPVSKVAIACGAAGEFLEDAIRLGCDAFVVGEVRFHTALEARAAGVSLFVPGHYASERPAVEWLAEELNREFDDVEWFASQVESDPLMWQTAVANG